MGRSRFLSSVCVASAMATVPLAAAQDIDDEDVIVVTGSNLNADQFQAVTPVDVYGRSDIQAAGLSNVTDLVRTIPENYGSEANRSAFTQNNTLGTAQINLRGLGLGATLVLTNGRRNVLSSTFANDGSQFVDTNQIPLALIERVEVVKTGASAIYGSDAVAGVVNFVTRSEFVGVELDGQYQTTTDADQEDITLNFLAGFGEGATHATFAATYVDRSELRFTDREFTGRGTELELATAKPGSFILRAPPMNPAFAGTPVGVPVADPRCADAGGNVVTTPGGQFCQGSTRDQFAFVPNEERLALYADVRHEMDNGLSLFAELSWADMEASIDGRAPSLPGAGASGAIIVSPTNDFNPFGAPLVYVGRPIDAREIGAVDSAESTTWRAAIGANWETDSGLSFDLSYVHGKNEYKQVINDLLRSELFNPGTTVVRDDVNLFATSITDPAQANDPTFLEAATVSVPVNYESELDVVEGSVSGSLMDTSSGPVGFAVGVQWRRNFAGFNADERLNSGTDLVFLFPLDDFDGEEITAASTYAEVQVPIGERIDIQAALRYENYSGNIGDTLDPKVAVTAELVPDLLARASVGTSFRAPTPLQTGGQTNQVGPIVNPCTGQRGAVSLVTNGNSDLAPEDATTYSAGLAYEKRGGFRASVDYWRYDYEDVITRQSPEGIAAGATCQEVAPGVFVPVADGLTVNPLTGQIAEIQVDFVNAGAIETDGVDLAVGYVHDGGTAGTFTADLTATFLTTFDVRETPDAPVVDRAGLRNTTSFTRSTPEARGNLSLGWERGPHRLTGIARYTSSYEDDLNMNAEIDSLTTFDLQYALRLENALGLGGTEIRLGAINITDEDPPFVFDRGGYDPLVGDPRGRMVYFGVTQNF